MTVTDIRREMLNAGKYRTILVSFMKRRFKEGRGITDVVLMGTPLTELPSMFMTTVFLFFLYLITAGEDGQYLFMVC